jgi:hypothetical protein
MSYTSKTPLTPNKNSIADASKKLEIDRIVETLLAHPERIEDVKARLNSDETAQIRSNRASSNVYDIEDYFDNLPV